MTSDCCSNRGMLIAASVLVLQVLMQSNRIVQR